MSGAGSITRPLFGFAGFLGAIFLIVVVFSGVRLRETISTFIPPLGIESSLSPEPNGVYRLSAFNRIGWNWRVAAVNGESVFDFGQYEDALSANGDLPLEIEVIEEDSKDQRSLLMSRVARLPDLAPYLGFDLVLPQTLPPEWSKLPFQPGDRLTHVEGQPISDRLLIESIRDEFGDTLNGMVTWYTVDRAGESLDVFLYWVDLRTHEFLFIAGVVFALLGFIVFGLKPHTRSSWGFLFFCLFFGCFWLLRSIPSTARTAPEYYVFQFVQAMLPLPTVVLLATFSPLRLAFHNVRPVAIGAVVFGFSLVAINQYHDLGVYYLDVAMFTTWGLAMIGILILGLTIDWLLRVRKVYIGTTERTRSRVFRFATFMSFAPIITYTLFYLWTDKGGEFQIWFELCILFFPLIIGYAIVRHNFLNLDEMLIEGLLFGLLLGGAGVILAQGVVLAESIATQSEILSPTMLNFGLAAGIFVVAAPVSNRLRRWIRNRFDRSPEDLDDFVTGLEQEDCLSLGPGEFFRGMLKRLKDKGDTPFATLALFHPSGGWWLGAQTDPAMLGPSTHDCEALFRFEAESPMEISSDAVFDDLRLSGIREQVGGAMRSLKAQHVFPLTEGGQLWGILSLGDRDNFRNRTPKELESIRRLASTCTQFVKRHFELAQAGMSIGAKRTLPLDATRSIASSYPETPAYIGPYLIDKAIGRGGMGLVFRGRDKEGNFVAVKVGTPIVQHDPTLLRRFMYEARAMLRLDHPHIVAVKDVGRADDEPYIVMEYLPGGSLTDILNERGPVGEAHARRIVLGLASALEYALSQYVFHRDIKPSNIMLDDNDGPKLADFGLAKIMDASGITERSKWVMGTPSYMAPELFTGKPRDWRADQYALGVTLFEMLAGERPFVGRTFEEMAVQHLRKQAPDIREKKPHISATLAAVIERLLRKEPEERFGSYAELSERLAERLQSEATTIIREDP